MTQHHKRLYSIRYANSKGKLNCTQAAGDFFVCNVVKLYVIIICSVFRTEHKDRKSTCRTIMQDVRLGNQLLQNVKFLIVHLNGITRNDDTVVCHKGLHGFRY